MIVSVQSSTSCFCRKYLASQWVECLVMDVQCEWKQPTIHHETNTRCLHQTTSLVGESSCSTWSSLTTQPRHSEHLQCHQQSVSKHILSATMKTCCMHHYSLQTVVTWSQIPSVANMLDRCLCRTADHWTRIARPIHSRFYKSSYNCETTNLKKVANNEWPSSTPKVIAIATIR